MESESGEFCWRDRKVAHLFFTSFLRQLNQIRPRCDVGEDIPTAEGGQFLINNASSSGQKINTWRSGHGSRAGKRPINPLDELLQRPYESFHCLSKRSWLYLKKRTGCTSISRLQTLYRSFLQRQRGKTLDLLLPLCRKKIALKQQFEAAVVFGGVRQSGSFMAFRLALCSCTVTHMLLKSALGEQKGCCVRACLRDYWCYQLRAIICCVTQVPAMPTAVLW